MRSSDYNVWMTLVLCYAVLFCYTYMTDICMLYVAKVTGLSQLRQNENILLSLIN